MINKKIKIYYIYILYIYYKVGCSRLVNHHDLSSTSPSITMEVQSVLWETWNNLNRLQCCIISDGRHSCLAEAKVTKSVWICIQRNERFSCTPWQNHDAKNPHNCFCGREPHDLSFDCPLRLYFLHIESNWIKGVQVCGVVGVGGVLNPEGRTGL